MRVFFWVRRRNAQRSQDNVEQFIRKANIEQWATVFVFFFRSWGCPVPGCLTNHLRKQKIVSSKLPLCLMARKQILISGFEVQIKIGAKCKIKSRINQKAIRKCKSQRKVGSMITGLQRVMQRWTVKEAMQKRLRI